MQHVEKLGHSNRGSGHWTAPKGLLSVDRMTQDSANPVREGHYIRAQCYPRHSEPPLPTSQSWSRQNGTGQGHPLIRLALNQPGILSCPS